MALVRRRLDAAKAVLSGEEQRRLDAMTPAEIEKNALTDPDNPPSTDEELARGVFAREVRRTREKLGLSQNRFAKRYGINLRRLQDWEQGRSAPDTAILAYLKVIAREPEMVRSILEDRRPLGEFAI